MSKSVRWVCLAIVGLACAGAFALAAAPEPKGTVDALVAEELKVCADAVHELDTNALNTTLIKPDDPRFDIWMQRWVRVIQSSGMTKAERIAALEPLLTLAKRHEDMAEQWVNTGQAAASTGLDARFRRLDVELALAREKAK